MKASKDIFSNANVWFFYFICRIKSFCKRRCCREHQQSRKDPKRYWKPPGLLLLELYYFFALVFTLNITVQPFLGRAIHFNKIMRYHVKWCKLKMFWCYFFLKSAVETVCLRFKFCVLVLSRSGGSQAPAGVFTRLKMVAGNGVMMSLMKKVRKAEQQFHSSGWVLKLHCLFCFPICGRSKSIWGAHGFKHDTQQAVIPSSSWELKQRKQTAGWRNCIDLFCHCGGAQLLSFRDVQHNWKC